MYYAFPVRLYSLLSLSPVFFVDENASNLAV
jgi:hypothetical protein